MELGVKVKTSLVEALQRVGRSVDELLDLLSPFSDSGAAYLVGSLACGYGNRRSDVDIHIFDADVESSGTPSVFFLGDTIVDVVHFHPDEAQRLSKLVPPRSVQLAGGRCALGRSLSRKLQVRLGRWSTAIPLEERTPPILAQPVSDAAASLITRGAIDDFVRILALAELATSVRSETTASAMWRKTARYLLEVVVRARGEIFVGEKWVWAKARRLGIDRQIVQGIDRVRSAANLQEQASNVDVPWLNAAELARLEPSSVEQIKIGSSSFVFVDQRRLLPSDLLVSGRLADEISRVGPDVLLTAIAYRAATLVVDDDAIDRALA